MKSRTSLLIVLLVPCMIMSGYCQEKPKTAKSPAARMQALTKELLDHIEKRLHELDNVTNDKLYSALKNKNHRFIFGDVIDDERALSFVLTIPHFNLRNSDDSMWSDVFNICPTTNEGELCPQGFYDLGKKEYRLGFKHYPRYQAYLEVWESVYTDTRSVQTKRAMMYIGVAAPVNPGAGPVEVRPKYYHKNLMEKMKAQGVKVKRKFQPLKVLVVDPVPGIVIVGGDNAKELTEGATLDIRREDKPIATISVVTVLKDDMISAKVTEGKIEDIRNGDGVHSIKKESPNKSIQRTRKKSRR